MSNDYPKMSLSDLNKNLDFIQRSVRYDVISVIIFFFASFFSGVFAVLDFQYFDILTLFFLLITGFEFCSFLLHMYRFFDALCDAEVPSDD